MRLIIASLLVFSIVILFLFALFPSSISVSRVVQINLAKEKIMKEISDLREWQKWNVLINLPVQTGDLKNVSVRTDSNLIVMNNMRIQLLKSSQDSIITRWQNRNRYFMGNFTFTQINGGVIVQWTLQFHIRWYPWEKLASMFYEKELGPRMEQSLINLEKLLKQDS